MLADAKLRCKAAMVGTALDRPARVARWMFGARHRRRHPELWDMHLEDRWLARALCELIGPTSNCIDAGAHIGSMTNRFIADAPQGTHVAIEPVPAKAAYLTKRYPDVRVLPVALGSEESEVTFYEDVDRAGYSSVYRPSDGGDVREYQVRVARLDELVDPAERVDLIKYDVEGAELDAMRGSSAVIDRWLPTVLFECGTSEVLHSFGYSRTELYDWLVSRGYAIYSIKDYVFARPPVGRDEFERQGTYPFVGFNYLAVTASHVPTARLIW